MKERQKNILAIAITLMVGAVLLAILVVAISSALRSDGEEDPRLPRATSKVLDELRGEYAPVYWLGRSFHSLRLSGAEDSGEAIVVGYGKPSCHSDPGSGSGCTYPILISSGESRPNPFFPPSGRDRVCVDHIGSAVLVTRCQHRDRGMLYSGAFAPGTNGGYRTQLQVARNGEVSIYDVAGHLTAINAERLVRLKRIPDLAHQLPPPAPISCPALRFVVRWWTRTVEKKFGPNPQCRPYGT